MAGFVARWLSDALRLGLALALGLAAMQVPALAHGYAAALLQIAEDARRDIEQETRRAIGQIRREVADLTVIATEKVARKTLDDQDHKRLIDEALQEFDFSQLPGGGSPTGRDGGNGSGGGS